MTEIIFVYNLFVVHVEVGFESLIPNLLGNTLEDDAEGNSHWHILGDIQQ